MVHISELALQSVRRQSLRRSCALPTRSGRKPSIGAHSRATHGDRARFVHWSDPFETTVQRTPSHSAGWRRSAQGLAHGPVDTPGRQVLEEPGQWPQDPCPSGPLRHSRKRFRAVSLCGVNPYGRE
jgi:hypothetical protein